MQRNEFGNIDCQVSFAKNARYRSILSLLLAQTAGAEQFFQFLLIEQSKASEALCIEPAVFTELLLLLPVAEASDQL